MTVNFDDRYNQQQMRQWTFDKQNNYSMASQLRSRQYSQLEPQREAAPREREPRRQYSYYQPKTFENRINNLEGAYPYERFPQRRDTFEGGLAKPCKPEGIGSYTRKRQQLSQKIDLEEEKPKFNMEAYNKRQDAYADHSFGQNSFQNDASALTPNKRQTAKRKGMDIKMTNIENINDKINSLLSMVKKDKIERHSKQKAFENSPKKEQFPSPTMNRAKILANMQAPQYKQQIRSGAKVNNGEAYNELGKQNKRVKTYSAVEQKKHEEYQYKRVKQLNEEDKKGPQAPYYPASGYSPGKNRVMAKEEYSYQKTRNQKSQQPDKLEYNPHHYKYPPPKQRGQKRGTESKELQRTASKHYENLHPKYEKIDIQFSKPAERVGLYQKREKTPPRANGDNFMPMSLLQNQPPLQRPSYQKKQPNSGMKMVDKQIKKIKEKISQSQSQYKKYQERLIDAREERNQANAGKIYTTDGSSKKFEIKVHPVVNDKPETVKLAQKLCYQIEMDSRMRKARQSFGRIEGQEKWRDLESRLHKSGVRLTFIELKDLLAITPDEFSPFDQIQTAESDIAKPFLDSQRFWEKEVSGCASSKSLKKEGFSISELDLNKKGHLSIEDIVCFVNLHTAHFYKNRDLTVIFRRLQLLEKCKKGSEIDFNTFFRAFTI